MNYEFIEVETNGPCLSITFNRPKLYNAMNRAMKKEIIKTIKLAGKDINIKSIILTGNGKAFSSGQDLGDRTVLATEQGIDLGLTLETEWNPLIKAIRDCPKIVIGAINGVVAGAGLSVALSCDLITAKPQTKFVSGFSAIGLAPDAGSSHLFIHHFGKAKTLEFFLLGTPLYSEDLKEKGLINEITEDPIEEANKMAEIISKLAPLSIKNIKKNLQFAIDNQFNDVVDRETHVQRFLGFSDDYQEGVKAFMEKRTANFKGK